MNLPHQAPAILALGLSPEAAQYVAKHVPEATLTIKNYEGEILETALKPEPALIITGTTGLSTPVIEVGQSLRMLYPNHTIFFLDVDRHEFHRDVFFKNGFTDSFLLPSDQLLLIKSIRRSLSNATEGQVRSFRKIQLIDVEPESKLGFDLYLHLPANNRRIRYVSGDESIGKERAAKLVKFQHQSAYVTEDEIKSFYSFTARQLKSLGKSDSLSSTERIERRERAVRDLLTGVFSSASQEDNLDTGRKVMSDCHEIVKSYMLDGASPTNTWYKRVIETATASDGNTAYSHAANTSTFAALLSIALGIGDPESLALAGLLHDIGLADVPAEITDKKFESQTPEEKVIFEKHATSSVRLIKERRMNVPERVCAMIEQHHERFDGTGYPAKMPGSRIFPDSQILALADLLDELTVVEDGRPKMAAVEAINQICEKGLGNLGRSQFDPQILRNLKSIFSKCG